MAMAWLWTGMVAVSLVFGILTGSVGELGGAALEGATAAVELCVSMAGIMCLWTGVMEVMEQCGLSRDLFTPTFAVSRVIGWTANILEQADDPKIIRPAARYVGPGAPRRVPAVAG